jgi:hypothetical protein
MALETDFAKIAGENGPTGEAYRCSKTIIEFGSGDV